MFYFSPDFGGEKTLETPPRCLHTFRNQRMLSREPEVSGDSPTASLFVGPPFVCCMNSFVELELDGPREEG